MAAVAAGGSIGATARWAVGTTFDIPAGGWPWPTLIVNVVGCLLIGFAAAHIERGSLRWDTVVTGLLGGFTTMSSFAVELNTMVDMGRTGTAVAYGAVTLVAGVGAVAVGLTTSATSTRTTATAATTSAATTRTTEQTE